MSSAPFRTPISPLSSRAILLEMAGRARCTSSAMAEGLELAAQGERHAWTIVLDPPEVGLSLALDGARTRPPPQGTCDGSWQARDPDATTVGA